jgi:sulfide:quinone oxidoreductase
VVIAGGGVAALETMLALHSLAGDRVQMEVVAPEPRFWYRPLSVAEPFGFGRAHHFELAEIAESARAGFTLDRLASVDADAHLARTALGAELEYDALVIACGAQARPLLPGALTFRGPADTDALRHLLAEAEDGVVEAIMFALPVGATWPLPLYELALLTAAHLEQRAPRVRLAIVTPEQEPLSLFGTSAGEAIRPILEERGIKLHTRCHPARFENGLLELVPAAMLAADRVVALPRLEGPQILGLPQDSSGFVATDLSGRVHGLADVYAVGDVTQFPVKQGGIATEQADAAAQVIAAQAGADVRPHRFEPVVRAILLTGGAPLYLRHEPHGGRGDATIVSNEALWWPPAKIAGRYLAPFLAGAATLIRH